LKRTKIENVRRVFQRPPGRGDSERAAALGVGFVREVHQPWPHAAPALAPLSVQKGGPGLCLPAQPSRRPPRDAAHHSGLGRWLNLSQACHSLHRHGRSISVSGPAGQRSALPSRATSRHFLELYPCCSEQLWTERVFLEAPDEHAVCAKNAIEWPMLRGEERIACQSDRTRLTRAPARQRSNLRPGRPLRCLIRAPDRAGTPAGHLSLSGAACSHKTTDQSVETMVARTVPG
jgi:hypothetical protein